MEENKELEVNNTDVIDDTASKLEATTKLLEEATQKINQLTTEMHELKVSNQEMALRIGLGKSTTDDVLFNGFSKYSKGGK